VSATTKTTPFEEAATGVPLDAHERGDGLALPATDASSELPASTGFTELSVSPVPAEQSDPKSFAALSVSAIAALILINALWSGSSVASKNGLADVGPYTLALLRFLPAGLLLYGLEWKQGTRPVYARSDWPGLFVLGALGISVTYAIFYNGVERSTATDVSLLFACEPLMIAFFAVLFLRERLKSWQWIGMLTGLLGIRLIVGQGGGSLLALTGLAVESSVSVLGKRLSARYRGLTLCAGEMLIGSVLLLPFAVWECLHHPPRFTPVGLGSVLYLTLICSALCYGVWYRLLEKYPVSAIGAFILVQPLGGPLLGWLLRGEPLKSSSAAGGGLVVLGLILTSLVRVGRKRGKKR
jgi:drug/metabolite transporter (DMT)-like permease